MSAKGLSSRLTKLESRAPQNLPTTIFIMGIPVGEREFCGYKATLDENVFYTTLAEEPDAMDEIQSWVDQISDPKRVKLVFVDQQSEL